MAENAKDENSLTESQENIEQNDNSFDSSTDDKIEIKEFSSFSFSAINLSDFLDNFILLFYFTQ